MIQLCGLLQLLQDNGDGSVQCNRCEEGLHIRFNAFSFPKVDRFDLIHIILGIPDMMWGISYQYPKDVGQVLGHPICKCTSARQYGHKGDPLFGSGVTHRILVGPAPVG